MQGSRTSHQEISLLLYQPRAYLPSFLPAIIGDHAARHLTYTHLNSLVNSAIVWRDGGSLHRRYHQRLADRCPVWEGDDQDHQIGHQRHPETEAQDLWTAEMPAFINHQ